MFRELGRDTKQALKGQGDIGYRMPIDAFNAKANEKLCHLLRRVKWKDSSNEGRQKKLNEVHYYS